MNNDVVNKQILCIYIKAIEIFKMWQGKEQLDANASQCSLNSFTSSAIMNLATGA